MDILYSQSYHVGVEAIIFFSIVWKFLLQNVYITRTNCPWAANYNFWDICIFIIYIYIIIFYLKFLTKFFIFLGARPEKGLKILPFSKKFKPKSSFWIFSKNSFRNELHTPFLLYLDTQHLFSEIFILFKGGSLKFLLMISKNHFN